MKWWSRKWYCASFGSVDKIHLLHLFWSSLWIWSRCCLWTEPLHLNKKKTGFSHLFVKNVACFMKLTHIHVLIKQQIMHEARVKHFVFFSCLKAEALFFLLTYCMFRYSFFSFFFFYKNYFLKSWPWLPGNLLFFFFFFILVGRYVFLKYVNVCVLCISNMYFIMYVYFCVYSVDHGGDFRIRAGLQKCRSTYKHKHKLIHLFNLINEEFICKNR